MKQHDASSADELLEMAEQQASGRSLQLGSGTCHAVLCCKLALATAPVRSLPSAAMCKLGMHALPWRPQLS